MSKTTPEEAIALAEGFYEAAIFVKEKVSYMEITPEKLAALIDEVRGVNAESPMAKHIGIISGILGDICTIQLNGYTVRKGDKLYTHPAPSRPAAPVELPKLPEPDPSMVDTVRFYFMHDNHAFTRLKGATLEDVLAHADEVESGEGGAYGMLCPAVLLCGDKEVRRVNGYAHAAGSQASKDRWNEGKAKWLKAMKADADLIRVMATSKEPS